MNDRRGASSFTIAGIALASVLVPLNSTMIAVALPRLAREFDITKSHAAVLVTVYLAAMLVGQPLAGRLGDTIGVRRLALIAVSGFGVFSTLAMVAGTFPLLVAFRGLQAAFAAAISPSIQAIIRLVTTPETRGRAFGLQGSIIGIGAGLGPVIGGLLISAFGWRAIFGVNVPLVVGVLVVLLRSVPASADHRAVEGRAGRSAGGGGGRLANPVFVASVATMALAVLGQYALLLVTPIVLDDRGWGSTGIGLGLSLLTVGMIVMSPSGGRWGDTHGRRRPTMLGLAAAAVAMVASVSGGDGTPTVVLLVALSLFGLGMGVATPGITASGLEAAPEHRIGLGAGLVSAGRYFGSITASVLLALLVDDAGHGVGAMLTVCCIGVAASVLVAVKLPGPARRRAEPRSASAASPGAVPAIHD